MLNTFECSICNTVLETFFKVPSYPLVTTAGKGRDSIKMLPLEVGCCPNCSHVQLTQQPTPEQLDIIYKGEYTSTLTKGTFASADKMALQCKKFLDFSLGEDLPDIHSVMEIGSFDGSFLGLLNPNLERHGCEPNAIGKEHADTLNIKLKSEYFNKDSYAPNSFDLVIMRHLIEHIPNPIEIIKNCATVLRDGGALLIETPRVEHTLSKYVIGNFYHQHLHYFSERSLPALLHQAGFQVESYCGQDFRQFVVARLRNGSRSPSTATGYAQDTRKQAISYACHIQALEQRFNDWLDSLDGDVAIYGASSGTTGLLLLFPRLQARVKFIVDGDPRKQGCKMPGTDIEVYEPLHLGQAGIQSVVIASDFFAHEILNMIQNEFSNVIRQCVIPMPEFRIVEIPSGA